MTLQPITKKQMEYIVAKYKSANISIVNKHAKSKKKKRHLEMDVKSIKLLNEVKKIEESKTIEKYGWFDKVFIDTRKNNKI